MTKDAAGAGLEAPHTVITAADLLEGGDAPAGPGTPYEMGAGDTFGGTIGTTGDRDWIAVELEAGTTYRVDLLGAGSDALADPYLRLYDSDGALVAQNDDITGFWRDSSLSYTPTQDGTYYISAGAYRDGSSGDYEISVLAFDPDAALSDEEIAAYLTDGYWIDSGARPHSFDLRPQEAITVNVTGLTAEGQNLAREALATWTALTGLTFVEVDGAADIVFTDDQPGAFASASYTAEGETLGAQVNVSEAWLNSYGTTTDSYSFQTYMHEIGHALGLGHAGPYDGSATYGQDNLYANDSWQVSVMSYFSQFENDTVDADYAYIRTPMPADLIAIGALYGDLGTQRGGDTVYGAGGTAGAVYADAYAQADTVAFTILDEGGRDHLDLSDQVLGVEVDLRPGAASSISGQTGNLLIANGTWIEDATGGAGDDRIGGNARGNALDGGGGDDRLEGRGGGDRLDGQDGADLVLGGDGFDTVAGGAGGDIVRGGNNADTARGGTGDDIVGGGASADALYGGGGDDQVRGARGDDRLEGDDGADHLLGVGGGDLLLGGAGNDWLDGGRDDDTLHGGAGDDLLRGRTGEDTLYGEAGADRFLFGAGDGSNLIADYEDGTDQIWFYQETGAATPDVTDGADGAVVRYADITVTVAGVDAADLTADDFVFV